MSDLIFMYDASDPQVVRDQIPGNARAVAGYVGPVGPSNRYVTFPSVVARFYPHAHCFSIAVHTFLIAACLDIETGDATPDQAPGWFHLAKAHGQWRPCFYANASTMPAVQRALSNAGIPRHEYRLWVAAFPGTGANVPEGMDAHQYTDHGPHGENYDISVCNPDFFPAPPTPPPGPSGTARFAGSYDLAKGHWTIHGVKGEHIQWDHRNRWATAKAELNVKTGAWRIRPEPYAPPSGRPRLWTRLMGGSR